jgi:hypothetical protein
MQIETIKDVVQTLFFLVVGVVTILTYLKARHTLLQPIRTEVFKEQVRVFSKILRIFSGKEEHELQRHFGLDEVFQVNMAAMFDTYANTFFGLKFERAKRPYSEENCPGGFYSAEAWEPCEGHLKPEKASGLTEDEKTKEEKWANYIHDTIYFPKNYCRAHSELKNIGIESPLLPSKLTHLLQDFLKTIDRSAISIGKFVVECAAEMPEKYPDLEPEKYPDLETFKRSVPYWMENRYEEKSIKLKPKAKNIVSFIKEYYDPDSIGSLLR